LEKSLLTRDPPLLAERELNKLSPSVQASYALYLCLKRAQPLAAAKELNIVLNALSELRIDEHKGQPRYLTSKRVKELQGRLDKFLAVGALAD
jgi:hypothetical protein